MSKGRKLAVIGGGPAGLMAACTAAARGARVVLLEKNPRCGTKLLITGAGQCNITSDTAFPDFLDYYPENKKFLYPAFQQFFVGELKAFFLRYGLKFILDESGKYFPETRRSQSVLDVLLASCHDNNVEIHCREEVSSIDKSAGGWLVTTSKANYIFDGVILATGGLSYPQTGSDGAGLRMAANLKHRIVTPRPALAALEISEPDCRALSGVSLRHVNLQLQEKSASSAAVILAQETGDLLFTHFGVSGPPVLFISRWLKAGYDITMSSIRYELILDILPDILRDELEQKLLAIFAHSPRKLVKTVLGQEFSLPLAAAQMLIVNSGLEENIKCHEITKEKRSQILSILKSFTLPVARSRGFREAMVTAGGVSTREINPRSMRSVLHPGLFLAGEIIDIDGFTGGYNLQAAFSTGYLAGLSAAGE